MAEVEAKGCLAKSRIIIIEMSAAIERMGLDVSGLAASVAAGTTQPPIEEKNIIVEAAQQVLLQSQQFQQHLQVQKQPQQKPQLQHQQQPQLLQQQPAVPLPSFYNPGAVNPNKYAQQIQKRKLLWANKKEEPPATSTAKIWEATSFNQDQDGKMTAKFKRLMGIKQDQDAGPSSIPVESSATEVLKKQQELFASLDQQYQVARATTHTQRGLGLGFSSNYPR
nr:EOG090X0LFN [Eurycercus lamellatus]